MEKLTLEEELAVYRRAWSLLRDNEVENQTIVFGKDMKTTIRRQVYARFEYFFKQAKKSQLKKAVKNEH